MEGVLIFLAACLMVNAAPPSQPRYFQAPEQQIEPIEFYLNSQEEGYYQTQQKHANNPSQNGAPSRLENLDPNNEVELIPGAEVPQQPPQQNPLAPNIPGLIPGQQMFIVRMLIPSPGNIGGYQPIYVLAAVPQGNMGYPGNGFQNGVLLNAPQAGGVLGYPLPGLGIQSARPPLFGQAPLNQPYHIVYQNTLPYQLNQAAVPVLQAPGDVKLNNIADPSNEPKNGQVRIETKVEGRKEPRNKA